MKKKIGLVAVIILLFIICGINCLAVELKSEFQIADNITVIELKAQIIQTDTATGQTPIVTLTKDLISLELVFFDFDTFELKFKNSSGELQNFYDKNGTKYTLKNTSLTYITIIYDDISGSARYSINGKLPYYYADDELKELKRVSSYNMFNQASGNESVATCEEVISEINIYNINDSGTAEVLAFQVNGWDDSIRILAGIDMPWYSEIGFELKIYINGIAKESENVVTNSIYKSLTADDRLVKATDYGYNYFSALVIKNVKLTDGDVYYIIARPYTVVSESKYYGTPVKIDISESGYEFDPTYKTQLIFENDSSFITSDGDKTFEDTGLIFDTQGKTVEFSNNFSAGEIYLNASLIEEEDCVFDVYIDDLFVTSINLESGRNNILIAEITEGSHTVKVENKNGYSAIIYGFTYSEQEHVHMISPTKTWSINNDGAYIAMCDGCDQSIVLYEEESPIFMLSFENSVSVEASQYEGFNVVNPNTFKIGADTDGDKALVAGTSSFYIDVDQATLAQMTHYSISFDVTVTKTGNSAFEISLLTLISNFRNGSKVSGKTADYEYFLKYNVKAQKFATIKNNGDASLLTPDNSTSIAVGTQYKINIVVDNINNCAHVFVNGEYIGKSEKAIVDVMSNDTCYPSFKFNDGGNCYPIYDNFKIFALQ